VYPAAYPDQPGLPGAGAVGKGEPVNDRWYPPIEPFDSGQLDVGDGQSVYWECCGNPDAKPVVFLHGGPGAGCTANHRRLFDPARYRIVLFDQRGCGRSTPHASAPGADLATNTTWHLVADIERLRHHLGIERWQVFGGSWGSALALAYAESHPDRVTELIVRGIFTLRRAELEWFYQEGASWVYPDHWESFVAPVPRDRRDDLIAAYHDLLFDPDPAVHGPAGVAWTTWEANGITLLRNEELIATMAEPAYALAFARIENHYFVNAGWFGPDQLVADAHRLAGIPGVIVQGRYDMCTPAATAWALHRAWAAADLVMVPDAGHAFDEPGILAALIAATDRFAD
jgi:proline iminopeptidase